MNSDIPEIEKAHLQRLAMLLSLGVGFFMLASKMLCTTTRQPNPASKMGCSGRFGPARS
jgi:hypothetical protein